MQTARGRERIHGCLFNMLPRELVVCVCVCVVPSWLGLASDTERGRAPISRAECGKESVLGLLIRMCAVF